ncbi:hypothetical protein [Bacillus cereus]|nr:hypothetical protein [Bacillus cereus]MCU5457859.1 hypothetical protein [Bacillus cereus]MED3581287.1 hypothetical protein [Bacillus thuringiensis]
MSPFAGDSPLQGDGNQKRNIGPHADIGVCVAMEQNNATSISEH